jgi:hypothetical protein
MRLFDYHHQTDFGEEFYLNVICTKYLNILQLELMWDDFPSWVPELSVSFAGTYKSLVLLYFGFGKFRFSVGFLCYGKKDLNWMRNGYGE